MKVPNFRWVLIGSLLLRVFAGNWAGDPATLGFSVSWHADAYRFSGGTDPLALVAGAVMSLLYFGLMHARPSVGGVSFGGVFRRIIGGAFDLVVFTAIAAPWIGIFPVLLEWRRTNTFAWSFERVTPANGDALMAAVCAIAFFGGLVLYHAIPLMRQRPTPGACICGYQVVADRELTLGPALWQSARGLVAVLLLWLRVSRKRPGVVDRNWIDRAFQTNARFLE